LCERVNTFYERINIVWDAVGSARILDGSITADDLADGAVTTLKIAAGAVGTGRLAEGAVSASISDGAVVRSVNGLTDAVTLAAGSNVTITSNGNTLTIASTGGSGSGGSVGSVSGLTGDITLVAGSNVTITTSGSSLTIASTAAGSANTLDGAYDEGGAGAGRVITADAGAVEIGGTDGFTVTDGAVLFTGTSGGIPATGAGTRLMWYPAKGAFRAGTAAGTEWDDASIGPGSTVAGGGNNTASGDSSVVGGGSGNSATNYAATVAGGSVNTASGQVSTVGGGQLNVASANFSTVAGGAENIASSIHASIGGGKDNTAGTGTHPTIAGGQLNDVTGSWGVISGGSDNTVSADYGMIPGGRSNVAAGQYSFAAGNQAKANHNGSFVWADQTFADFSSTAVDQFLIRAAGGVGISTDSPTEKLHVIGNILAQGNVTASDGANSLAILSAGDLVSDGNPLDLSRTGAASMRLNNDITFSPFGTTDAVIFEQSSGDVGIGVTPTARLNVKGAGTSSATSALLIQDSAGGQLMRVLDDGTMAFGPWLPVAGSRVMVKASGTNTADLILQKHDSSTQIVRIGEDGSGSGVVWIVDATSNSPNHWLSGTDGSNSYMAVFANSRVGFGTSTPNAKIDVEDGAVLFQGTIGVTPITGAGTRFIWIPAKAALRAGVVTSTQFDDANVGVESSVAGGRNNIGSGEKSAIGGGVGNVASGLQSSVGGGNGNQATGVSATVDGGLTNIASGDSAAIGGGSTNTASGQWSSVAGGSTNTASNNWSAVGGGTSNTATAQGATVAGGTSNAATSNNANVDGGGATIAGGSSNTTNAAYNTVGGGQTNQAITNSHATVAGGLSNTASGQYAFVGGGGTNTAAGPYGTVAGGVSNQVQAAGNWGSVGGGSNNVVSGIRGTIPGGEQNAAAGARSFAAGYRAKANHDGAFVWGDNNDFDFASTVADEFSARAVGGVRFVSAIDGSGSATAGVTLAAGGGSWSSISDSTMKEHVVPVDAVEIATRVASLPLSTWNYKSQADSIRHIGPMSQDFRAAFGVGEDERRIATIDADGVALAAIQGLYQMIRAQEKHIAALERRTAELTRLLSGLTTRTSSGIIDLAAGD
jgi:hypothetical protein